MAIHRLERGKYTFHRSYSKCVKPVFDACAVDDAAFEVASGNKIVRLSVDGEVLEEKTLHKGSVTALADSVSVSTDGLALAGSQRFEQSGCQFLGAAKVGSLGFALVTDSGKIAILDSSLSHAASYDAHCKGISGIVSLGASLFTCSLLEGSVCRYDSELELVEKKRCGAQLIFKMDSKLHMICGSNVCDASGSILSTDPRFNGAAAHEGTRFIGADGVLYDCGDGLTALQEGCACISGAVSADKAKQVYANLKPVFQHSPGVPTCILSLANGCIAVGDDLRRVRVYGGDGKVLANWAYHNARVVLLAQHKDLLFSAGLDNDIYGWRIGVDDPVVHLKSATTFFIFYRCASLEHHRYDIIWGPTGYLWTGRHNPQLCLLLLADMLGINNALRQECDQRRSCLRHTIPGGASCAPQHHPRVAPRRAA